MSVCEEGISKKCMPFWCGLSKWQIQKQIGLWVFGEEGISKT